MIPQVRGGGARSISKLIASTSVHSSRPQLLRTSLQTRLQSNGCLLRPTTTPRLAIATYKPITLAVQRHMATKVEETYQAVKDTAHSAIGKAELEHHPEAVSTESSIHNVFHEEGVPEQERDVDMMAGIKSDVKVIKDTFALTEVPREALYIGMAGVLPYLATSLSTVYLAWDINHAHATGTGLIFSEQTAELLLHIVQPLQIGYGAVIISFLGAIHWGLEWAKYGGEHGYRRYAFGIVAPAVAWPTILFPVEYALITQFLAFNFLYFADAQATMKGWTPPWYSTYRFVLTFIVGASIVASLIGRGQISDKINQLPGPAQHLKELRDSQMASLAEEEKERRAKVVAKDEEEENDEDE
ncbi:hypothetical protein MMC25_006763 [Agyrium rufum]|nr:hypothetical protein [Agyrium rufum]